MNGNEQTIESARLSTLDWYFYLHIQPEIVYLCAEKQKRTYIMKRIVSLIAVCLCAAALWADLRLTAPATDVTVFLNGAQVTRQLSVALSAGKQVLTFEGLSPYLQENSLQVSASGQVTILGVKRTYDYAQLTQNNQAIAELETAIRQTEQQITAYKTEQEVTQAELQFLDANKVLSGKNEAVSLPVLKQTLDYYRERLQAGKQRLNELALLIQQANQQLSELKTQLNQKRGADVKETSNVVVEVSCSQAAQSTFTLRYYVGHASWSALYDLRATRPSQPMTLNYKARVYQNTREDWKQVRLTLSSNVPTQNNTLPTLSPYKLSEPVVRRARYDYAEEAADVEMAMMSVPMMKQSAPRANEVATEVDDNLTAFDIRIQPPYTVPSSNEYTTVEVGVFDLPTVYQYRVIPKKDNEAFLTAKATDWSRHHLIAGQANIYFENTYIGQTRINPQTTSDTLTVSLGRDRSIVVTREEQTDYNKRRQLSSKTEVTKAFTLTVKNQKNTDIDLVLVDQVPVSTHSSIEVNAETDGGILQPATGEVTWKLNIPAKGETKKQLSYKVRYPKDWTLTID